MEEVDTAGQRAAGGGGLRVEEQGGEVGGRKEGMCFCEEGGRVWVWRGGAHVGY